jgi:RimJ/RimL family protein N-acetyltransferase
MASRRRSTGLPKPIEAARGSVFAAPDDIFEFIRAIPSDLSAIEAMFSRCSPKSRQRRFFRPVLSAPPGYVEEVLRDRDKHHAFVLKRNGETIGLAELHLTGPWSGDLALIVEDLFQRKGVGTAALQLLVCHGLDLGLRILSADVQDENRAVLRALRRVGPSSISRAGDVFHVELDLDEAVSAGAARLCAG